MKSTLISLGLLFFGISSVYAENEPLEYKVAIIDAGKYIPQTDSSVSRARGLLTTASKVYLVTPIQAADVAAKGKEIGGKSGISVSIAEILDGALVSCDSVCSLDQLRDFVASYITIRQATGQTHHQAVHGLLALNIAVKASPAKGKIK